MLEVEQLEVHYGRTAAVRGVSLRVGAGEIVSLVGPNGAGKSSLMLAVTGVLRPSAGSIRFEGLPIAAQPSEAIARAGISLVPEGRHVFGALTVEENLRLGTHMRRDREGVERDFRLALERFPFLAARLGSRAGKLSGGEQQQLVIARALLTRPKLMLIDEPSLGLAPKLIDEVYAVVRALRAEGITFLIVEQSTERALAAADRIYVMRNGAIALIGTPEELRRDDRIEQAYFGFDRH